MGRSLIGTLVPDARPRGSANGSHAPPPASVETATASGTDTRALIEHAFVLMLFGGLVLGVLMVPQPLATAILFGAVLAIATLPVRSALLRLRLGHGAAAAVMSVAAVLLAGLPILAAAPRLASGLAEGTVQLEALLATFPSDPPPGLQRLPLLGERLARGWSELASTGGNLRAVLAP